MEAGMNLIKDNSLKTDDKDEIIGHFFNIVLEEAMKIFETATKPIYLQREYGRPFYRLISQCTKQMSQKQSQGYLEKMITMFEKNYKIFENRIKCYDQEFSKDQAYCMNITVFKFLQYILQYQVVSIDSPEMLHNIIQFLHLFSLCSVNSPPINGIRDLSNQCTCILINKFPIENKII